MKKKIVIYIVYPVIAGVSVLIIWSLLPFLKDVIIKIINFLKDYKFISPVIAGVLIFIGYFIRMIMDIIFNNRFAGLIKYFPESDSSKYQDYIEKKILKAKKIVMIGTGLNILFKDPIRDRILKYANDSQCKFEIFLANPSSISVEERLIEEELGDEKPPVGRDGLIDRLRGLIIYFCRLGKPTNFEIKLFNNYPTFSLMIVDNEYIIYPYGMARLGNYSPVFVFSKKKRNIELIKFFDTQYKTIKRYSVNAELILSKNFIKRSDIENLSLTLVAVYFIPREESKLYTFGSNIIGYDIRGQRAFPSDYKEIIGSAENFGFHLTICDALYFSSDHEIETIAARVEYIVKKISPFNITNLQIQTECPDDHCISIIGKDITGYLEILHTEFVNHIYKMAIGSNYSFEIAPLLLNDQNKVRTENMIKWYNAPYILQSYKPHFTLCTKLKNGDINTIYEKFNNKFQNDGIENEIKVSSVSIVTKPIKSQHWKMYKEIPLGKD